MDQARLQTVRLVLRPYSLADVNDLCQLAGAREVAATTLRIPHPYRQQDAVDYVKACLTADGRGSTRFAITLLDGGRLCGGIGLHIEPAPAERNAELGYWLGVPYWGQGYATEAARAVARYGIEVLGVHRIYATHFAHNLASGRVLQKIGMRYEGRLRENVHKWGEFYDSLVYGMLASDLVPDP
ncbi:MAG TPA: GNAT family protein [Terriglobales bacterium]|nr:GNAT family protein [Terriglobales bacterium]